MGPDVHDDEFRASVDLVMANPKDQAVAEQAPTPTPEALEMLRGCGFPRRRQSVERVA